MSRVFSALLHPIALGLIGLLLIAALVWWVGPLVGGALAALLYEYLYLRPVSPEPVGPPETGLVEPRPGDAAAT